MSMIWTKGGNFSRVSYTNEADFESALVEVQRDLFGPNRIYLDVKKRIGRKLNLQNIPDGYLLDLSSRQPRLFVVENELASHEPLRHIAVQILEFSLSFESDPLTVKRILLEAIQRQPVIKQRCESYATANEFRNLDHMLDFLVHEAPFAAVVIIDEAEEELENALARKFQFGVEVVELARYENKDGQYIYHFTPFLADVAQATVPATTKPRRRPLDLTEVDTVVVPARRDGFQRVFIGENRWWAIRLHGMMRPQIKHIAAYQVAPVSAITHIARVQSIEPWKDTRKFVVNFAEPAREIGPIRWLKPGRGKGLQGIRYTTRRALETAKHLEDLW